MAPNLLTTIAIYTPDFTPEEQNAISFLKDQLCEFLWITADVVQIMKAP